jgi:hypothetical protein
MTTPHQPHMLSAPDPELRTSPILEESDDDFEVIAQEIDEESICYYNSEAYKDGAYVCSGSIALLHCEKGLWVRKGGCDLDNP